uniref:Ig-like domain-containing protein n=1 Tax=Neolamprologus brichardi TaxID=32507 RepID=A0A3Q4I9W2_NEOBR
STNWLWWLVYFSAGASPNQNENVHQTPTDLLKNITDGDKLTCKHKVKSYDTIVWYHRPAGDTSLKLVGFTSYKEIQTVEKPYEGLFSVSGNGEVEAFLHLGKLRHPENSGHYFCAVSSPTTAEKPEIPRQKPSSDPEHLQQTTLFPVGLISYYSTLFCILPTLYSLLVSYRFLFTYSVTVILKLC